MKLIIDIPKEKYKTIQEGMYCGMLDADLYRDIKNGIPHETVTEFADRCRECGREKVLDKIRAEIEQIIGEHNLDDYDFCSGLICARKIIDKYRAESEDKE